MKNRVIIRSAELFLLYTVVLLALFVWQFWRGSGLQTELGALHLTLALEEDEEGERHLKNDLALTFGGVTFAANDSNPAFARVSDDERLALTLADWEQVDDYSARFVFDDGSALLFSVSDATANATLTLTATLADGTNTLELPYKMAKAYASEDATDERLIFSNREQKYAFLAPSFSDGYVVFTPRASVASYAHYEPRVFSFSALEDFAGTDDKSYTASLTAFRDVLVTRTAQALRSSPASLTERDIVAYLAEMSFRGRLDAALASVPASFRNGNSRTYLSTPYFGNLSAMNQTLAARTARYAADVRQAIGVQSLAIFTQDGLADYILRERKSDDIKALLKLPATVRPFTPTVEEAAAILSIYTRVRRLDEELAELLSSSLDACVTVLTKHLSFDDGYLLLTAAEVKDEFASDASDEATELPELTVTQRLHIAQALLEYGRGKNRNEYSAAARLLINQELSHASELDVHELSTLYPLLVQDNSYYPHTEILGYYGEKPVWAWTIATTFSYKPTANGVVNVNIGFPLEKSQYIIITGVPDFHSQIEIQGIMFRTDPRFEAYNSSGYRYEDASETLLLKSRHKSQTELVRLFCDPAPHFTNPDDSLASMQQQVQDLGLSNVTVKKSDEGLTLSVENIQFEAESSVLRSSEFPKLQQIAQILKVAYLENDIMISGHTAKSSIGRPPQELSEERANTVADYLAELCVRERSHIFTQGFGDTKPVAPNDTEEERAKNRRVEITIMNK